MRERVARRYPTQPKAQRTRRLVVARSGEHDAVGRDDVRRVTGRGVDPAANDARSPVRSERPVLHPDLIRRTALLDWFSAHRTESVVAIVAGAGYGKTTLLAQADEADARPFGWVSLEERDNDPRVLATHVARGLDQLDRVGDQSGRIGRASINRPWVLVLDNVHVLRDRECLNIVAELCACVPHGSQLMLAGRAEPDVGLARVRAERRLAELDRDKLTLDPIEAGALLNAVGMDLPEAEVAELTRLTEGWAAGLYLTALSLCKERVSRSAELCPR
jgi:LuxR family transcriptional regulator, maltose regulon positive regulatory protein